MKQGIEKVLEEFETTMGCIDECKYGLYEDVGCPAHGYDAMKAKKFLRSAIETAFKEVSTADFSRQTARIFKNEAHQRGYIAALSDYDQAVDKYLGK